MPLEARLLIRPRARGRRSCTATTPVAIRVADRFEFYDRPVGYKGHARADAVPGRRGGGRRLPRRGAAARRATWSARCRCSAASLVLWVVGTIDDRRTVTPAGARARSRSRSPRCCGRSGSAGTSGSGRCVDLAVTALWIVAVVNAFNLFDNMDGAAASMAAVVVAPGWPCSASSRATRGSRSRATALCGACLGFLPHNLFARRRGSSSATAAACRSASPSRRWR